MSRFPDLAALAFAVGLAGSAMAEPIGLGRPATPDEVAAWDIDVRPDGLGLPEGIGSVADGESIFTEQCASCHGDFGEAVDRWPVLAGGQDTLTEPRPVKTIGSYWPYLSTVWDYVHRAMPFGNAQSLSSDETYALTAYLLYLNDMVDDDFELSRETFTDVVMPNADGFYPDDRMKTAVWKNRTPCMTDCKTEAKITARARVINVTPDDPTSPPFPPLRQRRTSILRKRKYPRLRRLLQWTRHWSRQARKFSRNARHVMLSVTRRSIRSGRINGPRTDCRYRRRFQEILRICRKLALTGWSGMRKRSAFLTKPRSMIKRTKMAFAGLKKEDDLKAVIAYMKVMSE